MHNENDSMSEMHDYYITRYNQQFILKTWNTQHTNIQHEGRPQADARASTKFGPQLYFLTEF